MNAYEKSKSLGLTGTDAEIVAQLQTITAQPINLAYLMEMLNFRGMLRKTDGSGGQERWIGTLQNLKSALVAMGESAAESVVAYETWFSHVTNPRQVSWDTSRPEYAIAFAGMQANFAGIANMPSVDDFDAVVSLGGGRPYVALTADDFATLRTAAEAQAVIDAAAEVLRQKRESLQQRFNDIKNQVGTSEQPLAVTALRAMADELEAG